jgi:3-hydroxybutyryl-CoA dehydrogenase
MTDAGRQGGMRIGVLGAGVMGAGIAQVMAVCGHEVVCHDVDTAAAARGRETAVNGRFGITNAVERGKLSQAEADAAIARLTFVSDFDMASAVDLVIEAVPENLALKVKVFRDLDQKAPANAILASNSSGFPIAALSAATDRPDRVIGWHWASPAPVMKLAEIVATKDTSEATIETVRSLAAAAGKNPVVVRDQPMAWGYVANRIYMAMFAEAKRVIDEGVAKPEEVDRLLMDCYRWPTGPFGMVQGATEGWKG